MRTKIGPKSWRSLETKAQATKNDSVTQSAKKYLHHDEFLDTLPSKIAGILEVREWIGSWKDAT